MTSTSSYHQRDLCSDECALASGLPGTTCNKICIRRRMELLFENFSNRLRLASSAFSMTIWIKKLNTFAVGKSFFSTCQHLFPLSMYPIHKHGRLLQRKEFEPLKGVNIIIPPPFCPMGKCFVGILLMQFRTLSKTFFWSKKLQDLSPPCLRTVCLFVHRSTLIPKCLLVRK